MFGIRYKDFVVAELKCQPSLFPPVCLIPAKWCFKLIWCRTSLSRGSFFGLKERFIKRCVWGSSFTSLISEWKCSHSDDSSLTAFGSSLFKDQRQQWRFLDQQAQLFSCTVIQKLMKENNITEAEGWKTSCVVKLNQTYISVVVFVQRSVSGFRRITTSFLLQVSGGWQLVHSDGLSIFKSHTSLWRVDINQRESSLTPTLESG